MDLLKSFFSANTKRGRAVRTALQAFVALLSFIFGILTIPGLSDTLAQNNLVAVSTFAVWTGVISYLYNAAEAALRFLSGE